MSVGHRTLWDIVRLPLCSYQQDPKPKQAINKPVSRQKKCEEIQQELPSFCSICAAHCLILLNTSMSMLLLLDSISNSQKVYRRSRKEFLMFAQLYAPVHTPCTLHSPPTQISKMFSQTLQKITQKWMK